VASIWRGLPEVAESFRSCEATTQRSVLERRLDRLRREPGYIYRLIVDKGGSLTLEGLSEALQRDDLLPLVFYQFAALLPPEGRPEQRIADGSAHREFLKECQLPRLEMAIHNAAAQIALAVPRGRGGDRRHGRWSATDQMISHLLGAFHDGTWNLPGYTDSPLQSLTGPAVEFVRDGLRIAGLRDVSDATLRRRIDAYRRNTGNFFGRKDLHVRNYGQCDHDARPHQPSGLSCSNRSPHRARRPNSNRTLSHQPA
jgi:hypothetical protein